MTSTQKAGRATGSPRPEIRISNLQRRHKLRAAAVAAFCAALLRLLGRPECALEIAFVGPVRMRRLNRVFRGRDRETDVLSFTYGEESVGMPPNLGTVVIAPSVALFHARRRGGEPEREVRTLLVHGVLHLLGYDHERDRGEMNALQGRLLRRCTLANLPPVWADPRRGVSPGARPRAPSFAA